VPLPVKCILTPGLNSSFDRVLALSPQGAISNACLSYHATLASSLDFIHPGELWIFSTANKHVASISMPESLANLNWGGVDEKPLFLTASTSVTKLSSRFQVCGHKRRI
jgi:hypothetical protein